MKRRLMAAALAMACMGTLLTAYLLLRDPHQGRDAHEGHPHALDSLAQTLLPVDGGEPVVVPSLIAADGTPFEPERLKGRWSLVFFGFTSCPDVCPTTLQLLSEVARHPASGIPHPVSGIPHPASGIPEGASGVPVGATQILFVTVDPQIDTPERMKAYLAHFDAHIVGLTGSRDAVDRFAAGLGAASEPSGSGGIDHSTSLFVLDPQGRLAGIMLRPADPLRIVADLNTLRTPGGSATHVSHAH